MSIASILFEFDPLLRLSDGIAIRWQTVALVAVLAAGLLLCGLIARREALRADDLLFITVATVPGAVVGGRLGYVLLHLEYYAANSTAITDPGQGSLELSLAVVGGAFSGAYVASLLGAPLGRWMRAAALPLLFVLGAGKLSMILGGSGQGQPSELPWATAFAGPGPWGSLAADLPSHPAQAYEGLATLALLLGLLLALAGGAFAARDGRLFLAGLAGWAALRALVAMTWRDPAVIGGIGAATMIGALMALGAGLLWVVVRRRSSTPSQARAGTRLDVDWADPETRPRF